MRNLLALFLFVCAAGAQTRHVVLVSLDGFAAYHLDNQNLELPNIRALAKEGVWTASSETVFPSVTHPSHTTLITGVMPAKHGVTGNELPAKDGSMIPGNSLPRSQVILTKTIFDAAKAKGLTVASFHWPETVDDASIDFNLVTRVTPGAKGRNIVKNRFVEELQADGVPVSAYDAFRGEGGLGLVGDAITTAAACHTIKKHKPNLIAIHLTNTDHEQHDHGPDHYLAQASLSKADYNVGQIVRALKEAGIYEQTSIFIAADHGFTSVYDEINLRPYLVELGLQDKVKVYEGGWAPFIRLNPTFDKAADGPKLQQLFDRLIKNQHVLRIYKSEEYPTAIGQARFEDSDRVRGQYLLVADVETYFVERPDNEMVRRKRPRPAHGHGYLPFHPKMFPVLVMAGSGLKKGTRIGHVHNADVAPTISKLLGLDPLPFDGKVLTEALSN